MLVIYHLIMGEDLAQRTQDAVPACDDVVVLTLDDGSIVRYRVAEVCWPVAQHAPSGGLAGPPQVTVRVALLPEPSRDTSSGG